MDASINDYENPVLVGSRCLGLHNEDSDYDYVALSDETKFTKLSRKDEVPSHVFEFKLEDLKKKLEFRLYDYKLQLMNYQYDSVINPAMKSIIEYSILNYKKEFIKNLKQEANKLYRIMRCSNSDEYKKDWYHIIYCYFIYLNDDPRLTEEQISLVKSVHDKLASKSLVLNYYDLVKSIK